MARAVTKYPLQVPQDFKKFTTILLPMVLSKFVLELCKRHHSKSTGHHNNYCGPILGLFCIRKSFFVQPQISQNLLTSSGLQPWVVFISTLACLCSHCISFHSSAITSLTTEPRPGLLAPGEDPSTPLRNFCRRFSLLLRRR